MIKDTVTMHVRFRRDQIIRLGVIQVAFKEKKGQELTFDDLLEQVVDEFLEKEPSP